jgi:small ligand-binding sensory domain FIST
MVSCAGRGRNLYGEVGTESGMLEKHLGPIPVTGFFAGGEIGPVGRRTYMHGYTSSLALLRAPSPAT